MSSAAIVKPDHLGDLVLASPAIRAIARHFRDVALFVGSGSAPLARFLFPEITDIRILDFPHLARKAVAAVDVKGLAAQLNGADMVFCLRDDPVLRDVLGQVTAPSVMADGDHRVHDTALHKRAIIGTIGNYSRTRLFSGPPIPWPMIPWRIGLCIAAGFPTNRWTNALWAELATRLAAKGYEITVIGGPAEREELAFLSRLLAIPPVRTVEGGNDFEAFLAAIDPVDLVIGTDGGTAHLCSLRKPVFSLFGSSPWRRYAPFGRNNVLLTRDEPCSPCLQFSAEEVNGCLTRECMNRLSVQSVLSVIESNGMDFSQVRGAHVSRGTSHACEAA